MVESVFDIKEKCSGCFACDNVCPVDAITMKEDEEGFLYPKINQDICIDCGICRSVCPFQQIISQEIVNKPFDGRVYGVRHKKEGVLKSSTSGGLFTALTDYLLRVHQGKIAIYGAVYKENFEVVHSRGTTKEERNAMRGSKYVKSNTKETYKQIEKDIKDGFYVLFSGTGCEVAGLTQFLQWKKLDMQKVYMVDIICHGTPSPKLWRDYLQSIQKKEKLIEYSFRDKTRGWHGFQVKAGYESGKVKKNTPCNFTFAHLFGTGVSLRPSCYACPYTKTKRESDIMLGDYWGVEKVLPTLNDNKGVSLTILSTDKGKELYDAVAKDRECIESYEVKIEDAMQYNLKAPTPKPQQRELFFKEYEQYGYEYIAKKYGGNSVKGQARKLAGKIKRKILGEA